MLCSYMSLNLLSFVILCFSFFFFNDTATTEIYTLSLHDALPIYFRRRHAEVVEVGDVGGDLGMRDDRPQALPIGEHWRDLRHVARRRRVLEAEARRVAPGEQRRARRRAHRVARVAAVEAHAGARERVDV